jgi:hypothetical protein
MFTRLRRKRHIWREGVPVLFKNVITQSGLRRDGPFAGKGECYVG